MLPITVDDPKTGLCSFQGQPIPTTAEIRTSKPWGGLDSVRFRLGTWNRNFLKAEQAWNAMQHGEVPAEDPVGLFRTLAQMMFTRDERLLGMAEKYLTLGDLLGIWKRMIGTGLIGGKSVGMIVASLVAAGAGLALTR